MVLKEMNAFPRVIRLNGIAPRFIQLIEGAQLLIQAHELQNYGHFKKPKRWE